MTDPTRPRPDTGSVSPRPETTTLRALWDLLNPLADVVLLLGGVVALIRAVWFMPDKDLTRAEMLIVGFGLVIIGLLGRLKAGGKH